MRNGCKVFLDIPSSGKVNQKMLVFYVIFSLIFLILSFLGVVPRLCEEIFKRIESIKSDSENKTQYEVSGLI